MPRLFNYRTNTQRPEWNDANNALFSVVTLCQLRRLVASARGCFERPNRGLRGVGGGHALRQVAGVLGRQPRALATRSPTRSGRRVLEALGAADDYRQRLYTGGFSDERAFLVSLSSHCDATSHRPLDSCGTGVATAGTTPTTRRSRRTGIAIRRLDEMLEGQGPCWGSARSARGSAPTSSTAFARAGCTARRPGQLPALPRSQLSG